MARALAEKATSRHTFVVTLTYGNETQEQRDGAAMFRYADIRLFLARLRDAAWRRERRAAKSAGRNPVRPIIRFICAGEQGERLRRCHWHLVLYSDVELRTLGVATRYDGAVVTDPEKMLWTDGNKVRLRWTMWPLGLMIWQVPDQGGMNYALSYALKDQFTADKSRETMREAKAENFATGLFRPSKFPPIGYRWLFSHLAALDAKGWVLPSTRLQVPGMSGYWHPGGMFRQKLLYALVALNQRAVWATGANAPQWSSLLASCKDSESDMEILNGKVEEEDEQSIEDEIRQRARDNADRQRRREIVRRCSKKIPCRSCLNGISLRDLERLGVRRVDPGDGGPWEYTSLPGHADIWDRWHDPHPVFRGDGLNPWCNNKGTAEYQRIFPASGAS